MKYYVKHKHHEQVLTAGCVTVTMISLSWDKVQNRTWDLRESQITGGDVVVKGGSNFPCAWFLPW